MPDSTCLDRGLSRCALEHEIDDLIAAFYAAFDNRGGRRSAIAELRAIFAPEAVITRVSGECAERWTVDGFVLPREAILTDGTLSEFCESEVTGSTCGGGRIASRMSVYEKQGVLDSAAFSGGGRELVQMLKDGDRWRICSILWEDAEGAP